jgi:hypothetical protein
VSAESPTKSRVLAIRTFDNGDIALLRDGDIIAMPADDWRQAFLLIGQHIFSDAPVDFQEYVAQKPVREELAKATRLLGDLLERIP